PRTGCMATRSVAPAPRRSSSSSLASPHPAAVLSPPPAAALRMAAARTGDHLAIHSLLHSVFHGPSATAFQAQLDEPGYQAADRLVVKDGPDIVAHLRLAQQTIQLDGLTLPAVRFMDLVTAPEYRSRGLAT